MAEHHVVIEGRRGWEQRNSEIAAGNFIAEYLGRYIILIIAIGFLVGFIREKDYLLITLGNKIMLLFVVIACLGAFFIWYSAIKEFFEEVSGDWSFRNLIRQRLTKEFIVIIILVLLIWWLFF